MSHTRSLFVALFAVGGWTAAPGCSSETPPTSATPDAPTANTDPFAAQPDESGGLTNTSADLDAVLEHGALDGACDRYRAGQTDRQTLLLCGKWMYFYESFGTAGIPRALVTFLAQNFPDQLGVGMGKLGLVPDPSSADHLPLGFGPTTPYSGNIDAVAFTCASCHFAQLSDGRYAVGAPNHRFDYARMILTLTVAPAVGSGLSQASAHDAAAIAKVQPVLDALASDATLKNNMLLTLLPLASISMPTMTTAVEHAYATWPLGSMDFLIAPLAVDDDIETVSKISGLWGLPRPAEIATSGMSSALLGWTGDTRSLDEFVRGFATLGGHSAPDDAAMLPLIEYIYSLRAPENPSPPDPAQVATGAALFTDKGCATCHDGPRGSGKRAYRFDEIGTDPALAGWADPTLSGTACCGLSIDPGQLTHGVKSPRLVGMWATTRFLHDGALADLDQLFCLADRPPVGSEPLRSDGHAFTCDGLSVEDRRALEAYVLAH